MASAQNGSLTFVGSQTGKTYLVDMYTSDAAAGTLSTFNPSGLAVAGSPAYWRAPENVILVDFAMHTGTTQTGMVMTQDGAIKNGAVLNFQRKLTHAAKFSKVNQNLFRFWTQSLTDQSCPFRFQQAH